jgi:putative ABC transport system permease protein
MVAQLLLVGYILGFVFESNRISIIIATLSLMLAAASWIAMRPLRRKWIVSYVEVLMSIGVAGILTLMLVTQGVLRLERWHEAHVVIPLAGMIFSNAMNTLSLAAERFEAEIQRGIAYPEARRIAFRTALIPLTNTLLAVGIVSFPGMMTGQILSGVSPLIAVRYQILVMSMIFGSSGLATASYLMLQRRHIVDASESATP